MNECPKCGTTYQDQTLFFCLEDGEKLRSENSRVSIPTVVLPKLKSVTKPIEVAPETNSSVKYFFALAIAAVLIFVLSAGVMGFLLLRNVVSANSSKINLDNNSQKTVENSNISQPQSVTPNPQPTAEDSVEAVIGEINTLPIYFASGKTNVAPESKANLEKIAEKLKTLPKETKIEIGVHTDNVGDRELNVHLSMARAIAIKTNLVALRVKSEMLSFAGYGGSEPVAPNDTEENRAKNRRIEFKLVKAGVNNSSNSDAVMIDLTKSSEVSSLGDDIEFTNVQPVSNPDSVWVVVKLDKEGNYTMVNEFGKDITQPKPLTSESKKYFEEFWGYMAGKKEKIMYLSPPTKIDRDILIKAIKSLKDAGVKRFIIFPKDN